MNEITYYQDREEESSIFKFDWGKCKGYIWNYRDKKWSEYEAVAEYVGKQDNLRCLSEERVKEEIEKNS